MRMQFVISLFATALFALSAGGAAAQHGRSAVGFEASAAAKNGTPPRASTTGKARRSTTAATKGANNPTFCPPGQGKKTGAGSAFRC